MKPQDRQIIKTLLKSVLDDTDLKAQFDKAKAQQEIEPQDYRVMQLGIYAGILQEIMDERANPPAMSPRVKPAPSLNDIRKKYLGK